MSLPVEQQAINQTSKFSVNRTLAHIISVLSHPLLMCTYFSAIVVYLFPFLVELPPQALNLKFVGGMAFFTFVVPLFALLIMSFSRSVIKSLQMENREERVMPFFFVSFYYGLLSYLIIERWKLTGPFGTAMVIITFLIILLSCITLFYKISVHSAGWGGLLGFVLAFQLNQPVEGVMELMALITLFSGLTMSARLYLNAHKPDEVYWGWLLGMVVCFGGASLFM